MDIWGPYRVQTRRFYRYFLTLVDDHSRLTWVSLMKHKSEVSQILQNFVVMAETQYGKRIKVMRSDNGVEFQDHVCLAMYKEHGIVHETSCVDTPEQNGRVERKHVNLLEMCRALRFQAGLPLKYWGDCLMAAVYITNKIPTVLHNNKTPHEESVYMKFPPGYEGEGHRIQVSSEGEILQQSKPNEGKVCKLLKSLYGLKQAPRKWFEKLSQALKDYNFLQSKSDYSLFTKHQGDQLIVVLVYVDDLLVVGNDYQGIQATKKFLSQQFHMKDIGSLRYFLGIEVDMTPKEIFISQKRYILHILAEYGMSTCKAVKLPLDTHMKLTSGTGDALLEPAVYQKLVGKLIYLTITRPDIAFSVHVLSQFMHCPTNVHLQSAKRVLRYLKGTSDQGVFLANSSSAQLTAYCDSDWAGCA